MSTVFSRRSFLKYTAVAAVAVAGTSLLGGCSGEEVSVCTEVGENASNTVLQVKSTLTEVNYVPKADGTADVTFHLHIKNVGRKHEIYVTPTNFTATALITDENSISYPAGSLLIERKEGLAQIARGNEAYFTVTINVPADVQQLTFTFKPDTQYNEYRAIWILTPDKFNPTSGTTEQPGEGSQD